MTALNGIKADDSGIEIGYCFPNRAKEVSKWLLWVGEASDSAVGIRTRTTCFQSVIL